MPQNGTLSKFSNRFFNKNPGSLCFVKIFSQIINKSTIFLFIGSTDYALEDKINCKNKTIITRLLFTVILLTVSLVHKDFFLLLKQSQKLYIFSNHESFFLTKANMGKEECHFLLRL